MKKCASEIWIFGYGSLIWRPDFAFEEKHIGYVKGWSRKFYQGSTDHRGTPENPGRVATLIKDDSATCWGTAFKIKKELADAIFIYLDDREKGGFSRHEVSFYSNKINKNWNVYVYIAENNNENYLGMASNREIAQQIYDSHGPSGPNTEYLLRLAESLRDMEATDDHVFELEKYLKEIMKLK